MFSDLLKIPLLGRLLRSPWSWRLVRLLSLVVLVVMAAYGWHQHAIPGVAAKDPLMYLNLANYFFWVLWIMAVVLVALFFGRAWCAVCPLGWLNGLVERWGLGKRLPKSLRGFVPVTLTLIGLQLLVYFLALHRYPDYTARLLAALILVTIACGLLLRGRAFCHLFCPAGTLFGLYARVAPFQLRVRDVQRCTDCDSHACISRRPLWKRFALGPAQLYWQAARRGCPVNLVPERLSDSVDCSLCLNCLQQCDKENIKVGFRPWLVDLVAAPLRSGETLFLVVLLGLLTANFSKVNVALRDILLWAPENLARLLGWQVEGYYLLAAIWIALLLPLLLLLPGWLVWRGSEMRVSNSAPPQPGSEKPLRREDGPGFWQRLGLLGLPVVPLLLFVHLILAVVKLNAKGGYLPLVLQDPSGVRSYLAINTMQTISAPGVLVGLDLLKYLALALLLVGLLVSWFGALRVRRGLNLGRGYLAASLVTLVLLSSLYGATILRWLFIR